MISDYYSELDKTKKMCDDYASQYGKVSVSKIRYSNTKQGKVAYNLTKEARMQGVVASFLAGPIASIPVQLITNNLIRTAEFKDEYDRLRRNQNV